MKKYVRAILVIGFLLLDGFQHAFVDGYLNSLYEPDLIYEKIKLVFLGAFLVSIYEFFFISPVIFVMIIFSKLSESGTYLNFGFKKVEMSIKLFIVVCLMSIVSYVSYYGFDIGIDYKKDLIFYEHMFSSGFFGVAWLIIDWKY